MVICVKAFGSLINEILVSESRNIRQQLGKDVFCEMYSWSEEARLADATDITRLDGLNRGPIMTRFLTKWALAVILGGSAWAASAGPAAAQFMPMPGWGFPSGVFYSTPFGNFAYNSFSRTTFGYSFVNPYTGGLFTYNFDFARTGFPGAFGGFAAPPAAYSPGFMAGGYGAYNQPTNPVTMQQLRLLRGSAPKTTGPAHEEQWPSSPRWTTAAPAKPAPGAAKPAGMNEALVNASEEEIQSGRSLNSLAIEIRRLEEQGAKAEAPLFPAEVLAKIAYDGPGAGLLTVARAGKPIFPPAMGGEAFADLRANLEKHTVAVLEPVTQGQAADPMAADRLAAAARKAKEAAPLRDLPADEAATVTGFLDSLEGLAEKAKDPSLAGIYPKWGAMGANASELVRHMGRHRLTFAPAPAGSEQAYAALHRGLSGYYLALAQTRK
jgi:hypothetical protein